MKEPLYELLRKLCSKNEEANRDKVFVMLAYVSNNITPNTIINSYYYDIIIFCDVI